MVDIHCHILPETDDGAKSWDIAVEMCRLAAADGITHTVATPHANTEFGYDRNKHEQTLARLAEMAGGLPALSLGCDMHLSYDNFREVLTDPQRYAIRGTDYVLVELSDYSVPHNLASLLQQLMYKGLQPIITHPERNPLVQRRPKQVLDWAELGAIIQVTANALTGAWGAKVRKLAEWMVKHDAVHVVASDAHDPRRRPPLLSPARSVLAGWGGDELATALVESNPRAIIEGKPLPYFPPPLPED